LKPDQAFDRLRRTLDGTAGVDERVPCLPVLKSHAWARDARSDGIVVRDLAPPDGMPDDAPRVAYAVDLGEAVVFAPTDHLPDSMSPDDLHEFALDNLRRELTGTADFRALDGDETESIGQRVLAYCGNYYATEAVLCPEIMREAQRELGADFLAVSMPERGQLLVTDGDADEAVLLQFAIYALCRHHLGDAAHVSEHVFAVKDGELVGHIRGLGDIRRHIASEAAKHHAASHASVVTRFADRDDEDGTSTLCTVRGSDPATMLRQLEGRLREWAVDNRRDPERTRRIEVTFVVATEEEAADPELADACRNLESFLTRQFEQLDAGPHADEPYAVTIRPAAGTQLEESLPMSNDPAPTPGFTEDEWSLIADAPYIRPSRSRTHSPRPPDRPIPPCTACAPRAFRARSRTCKPSSPSNSTWSTCSRKPAPFSTAS
jgi:hypothetical protein